MYSKVNIYYWKITTLYCTILIVIYWVYLVILLIYIKNLNRNFTQKCIKRFTSGTSHFILKPTLSNNNKNLFYFMFYFFKELLSTYLEN